MDALLGNLTGGGPGWPVGVVPGVAARCVSAGVWEGCSLSRGVPIGEGLPLVRGTEGGGGGRSEGNGEARWSGEKMFTGGWWLCCLWGVASAGEGPAVGMGAVMVGGPDDVSDVIVISGSSRASIITTEPSVMP